MKIVLTTLALTLAPVLATAQCIGDHGMEQAQSCVTGTQWDTESASCVPTVAS